MRYVSGTSREYPGMPGIPVLTDELGSGLRWRGINKFPDTTYTNCRGINTLIPDVPVRVPSRILRSIYFPLLLRC